MTKKLTAINNSGEFNSQQWSGLISFAPDSIFITRMETFEFVEVSDFACDYYGYTREEFLEMQIFDVAVNPPLVSKIQEKLKNIPIDKVFEIFGYHRRRDESIFPVHIRLTVLEENYALAFVRDISVIEDEVDLEIKFNRLMRKDTTNIVDINKLSKRESEVLILIGKAMSNAQIAEKLKINVKTVSTYRARLLQKLGLKNNTELAQYAVKI